MSNVFDISWEPVSLCLCLLNVDTLDMLNMFLKTGHKVFQLLPLLSHVPLFSPLFLQGTIAINQAAIPRPPQ